jgi:hypothetical protein
MCMLTLSRALKSDLEDVQRRDVEVCRDDACSYPMLRQLLDVSEVLFLVTRATQPPTRYDRVSCDRVSCDRAGYDRGR